MAEQINLQDLLSELRKTGYQSTVRNNMVETILEGQPVYTFISDWDRLTVSSICPLDGQDPIAPLIAANETMRAIGYVRIYVQTENETVLFSVDFPCEDITRILPLFSRGLEVIKSVKEAFGNTMKILLTR